MRHQRGYIMEMVDVKKSKNFKEKISCLIDYYVLQYGEKYRDLITRRFNDIVFCIYQSNDFYTYLEMNYNRLISLYAIRYLSSTRGTALICSFLYVLK